MSVETVAKRDKANLSPRFNSERVVKPEALVFYHYLEHEGSEVTEGLKYVLRTDIMYRLKDSHQ